MEASFSPPNLKRIGYPKNTIYMTKIDDEIEKVKKGCGRVYILEADDKGDIILNCGHQHQGLCPTCQAKLQTLNFCKSIIDEQEKEFYNKYKLNNPVWADVFTFAEDEQKAQTERKVEELKEEIASDYEYFPKDSYKLLMEIINKIFNSDDNVGDKPHTLERNSQGKCQQLDVKPSIKSVEKNSADTQSQICECGHNEKEHRDYGNNQEIDYCMHYDKDKEDFCRCGKFKPKNGDNQSQTGNACPEVEMPSKSDTQSQICENCGKLKEEHYWNRFCYQDADYNEEFKPKNKEQEIQTNISYSEEVGGK